MFKGIPAGKIVLLWLTFTLGLLLTVLFMATGGFIKVAVDFKELFFAVWGYGWDGAQYLEIVTKGYRFPNQAFFPLYPLIVWTLHLALPLTVSYRINILLSLALLFVLYRSLNDLGIEEEADKVKAIAVYLFFATSFYLQASYAETVLITLSALALIKLHKKEYFYSALFAGLATATKPNGVVVSIVLISIYFWNELYIFEKRKLNVSFKKIVTFLLLILISNIGILSYFGYLNFYGKGIDSFFRAQKEWGRGEINILQIPSLLKWEYTNFFSHLIEPGKFFFKDTVEVSSLTFLIIMLIVSFKKLPKEYYLFSLGQILLPLASGTTLSIGRFALVNFPLILFFSKYLKSNFSFSIYLYISTLLQIVLLGFFMSGKFVG